MPDEFRLPDGTWACLMDGVTEPCGDCDGCREIAAINAADDTFLGGGSGFFSSGIVPASNETGIYVIRFEIGIES